MKLLKESFLTLIISSFVILALTLSAIVLNSSFEQLAVIYLIVQIVGERVFK